VNGQTRVASLQSTQCLIPALISQLSEAVDLYWWPRLDKAFKHAGVMHCPDE